MLRTVTAALIVALMLAGCGGDEAPDGSAPPGEASAPSSPSSTPSSSVPTSSSAGGLATQFGVRYCEILAVTVADQATTAEVWGSQGLNDCPQAAFDRLDADAVADDLAVNAAVLNGPRYWVLDEIVANELAGSLELRSFGEIEMRSIAVVDLGAGVPDRSAYTETSVRRDTEFVFAADREVYELTGPDGSVYVMQSFSIEVDPTLAVEDLSALGDRLALPDGWSYASRVLDETLVVEDLDGVATVVQDDLRNSYQLRSRG